ncbi:NACHT, LRR and PYD domains-containing protein 3-like isoform X2 [Actinia tenebrosa]|uniref:NACHT, LRR and PYD domains-containing protein 3-like isoform X2 n=1 Tax=Actinia tenebrosa TaxID=6105 RepID=A0A6P8J525_ACTTE|nr:NACHT, LRR and PYD domains-containing protein 3-like isoform X2 [Actinia tenebrosa]
MDKEERNYCCLALLLLRVGNPCLRCFFKRQWNAAVKYKPWSDCAQNGADLLQMFKPLPYEKNAVRSGDTLQWDMSLLVKTLLHSRPAFVVAANLVAALKTLKEMRDKLCHSPIPRVEATDFQTSWRDGCNALSLFGATAGDFDKVEQDVQKPWSELLPMLKHCADQDKAILDTLDSFNSKLGRLQQGQVSIAGSQAELLQGQKNSAEGQAKLLRGQDTILKDLSSIKQDQRKGIESHAKEYTEKLKSSIKQQTDFLLSEEEDKNIKTDDIFTSVTIQRGPKHFEEPKEKRFGRKQIDEIQASSTKLVNCSKMFLRPENDDQKSAASCTTNPKSILLTGKAGIGKSLFCRKLARDWSHNRLFEESQENAKVPDFQFVFLLTFCQLQEEEKKVVDLRDILNQSSLLKEHLVIDESLLQYMIDNPEKLLIILDGYDEYKHREKITEDFETRYPNDPHEKIPVPALIAKMMKRKMLNGAVLLLSSRPGEAEEF